jgi:hypothetical protein
MHIKKIVFYQLNIILFILLFLPQILFAQHQTDSLKLLLPKSNGEQKVDLLNKLALAYAKNLPDSGLKYAQDALKLADELGYLRGLANAHLRLSTIYVTTTDYDSALSQAVVALELFDQQKK